MTREGKTRVAAEKLAILRQHLVEKVPISNLCDRHGIQPSQIYQWQALLFERETAGFERKAGWHSSADAAKDRQLARLEVRLAQKIEVIAELMEASVAELKKEQEKLIRKRDAT